MRIRVDLSSLSEAMPHEYAMRFISGGTCTALAWLIAERYGPEIGGLFLAFPAIFPAAASLIQSHEIRRKARIGKNGADRGRNAAALDAFGAALGSLGLIGFAAFLWKLATVMVPAMVLSVSLVAWVSIAFGAYMTRQFWPRRRAHQDL